MWKVKSARFVEFVCFSFAGCLKHKELRNVSLFFSFLMWNEIFNENVNDNFDFFWAQQQILIYITWFLMALLKIHYVLVENRLCPSLKVDSDFVNWRSS